MSSNIMFFCLYKYWIISSIIIYLLIKNAVLHSKQIFIRLVLQKSISIFVNVIFPYSFYKYVSRYICIFQKFLLFYFVKNVIIKINFSLIVTISVFFFGLYKIFILGYL
ncbi:hypothetical protein H311_00082 [Anncaliia algerae PRA109]|nr:hypothetical protein H311_00082 [Anncaliia algerae PRA109]